MLRLSTPSRHREDRIRLTSAQGLRRTGAEFAVRPFAVSGPLKLHTTVVAATALA
jgi:hypothetical protein